MGIIETGDRTLRLILVGQTMRGARTLQRAQALGDLGHDVRVIPTNRPGAAFEDPPRILERIAHRVRLPNDPADANGKLLAETTQGGDLIWVENAGMIHHSTLASIKRRQPLIRLVWYAEDDMMLKVHRTRWLDRSLSLFDLWVTAKSFNAEPGEMMALGVRRVLFVNNSYDPKIHRPMALDEADRRKFEAKISFIGTYEEPRGLSVLHLAESGFPVSVWGNGWGRLTDRHPLLDVKNRPIYDDDFAKAISASQINLAFLRRSNRDLQTCRSMEIPASGGFMLHQRNSEIKGLFAEDREATYFDGDDELVGQCGRWLADDERRQSVAAAGYRRVVSSGHSHQERLRTILGAAMETCP